MEPPPSTPTFVYVVAGSSKSSLPPRESFKYKGVPAINFTKAEVNELTDSLKYSLVGTFWYGRPKLESIRAWFEKVGFLGMKVNLLDTAHILITFDHKSDYIRCFARRSWNVLGFHMRLTKWSYDFDPKVDTPIVSVWISMPGLPVYLHK